MSHEFDIFPSFWLFIETVFWLALRVLFSVFSKFLCKFSLKTYKKKLYYYLCCCWTWLSLLVWHFFPLKNYFFLVCFLSVCDDACCFKIVYLSFSIETLFIWFFILNSPYFLIFFLLFYFISLIVIKTQLDQRAQKHIFCYLWSEEKKNSSFLSFSYIYSVNYYRLWLFFYSFVFCYAFLHQREIYLILMEREKKRKK